MSDSGSGRDDNPGGGLDDVFGDDPWHPADLGDVVVMLLAGTLAGLRDRLFGDGFEHAAELVGDLVEIVDDYICRVAA